MQNTDCLWEYQIQLEKLGPLSIDYRRISCYFSKDDNTYIVFLLLMLLWVLWLIYLLGQTASNYFSPTLRKICRSFQIDRTLAGITLLAYANGAPDVFSVLASFKTSPEDPSIGVSSIVGGTIIITTIVVGCLSIITPFQVPKYDFLRDCLWHLFSISVIAILAYLKNITVAKCVFLLVLYGIYIFMVLVSVRTRSLSPNNKDDIIDEESDDESSCDEDCNKLLNTETNGIPSYNTFNTHNHHHHHDTECHGHIHIDHRNPDPNTSPAVVRASNYLIDIFNDFDWKELSFQRRSHHRLISKNWSTYSCFYKFIVILESPFFLLRDISIPSLSDHEWNKIYAILHPYLALLIIVFLYNKFSDPIFGMNPFLFCFGVGSAFAAPIYFLTSETHPKSPSFNYAWMFMALLMSNLWVYFLAEEIVTALKAVGNVFRVENDAEHNKHIESLLGMTVLAWGNSIPDLFNNLSCAAKPGGGSMAIAACYGGPIFNLLVGFGLSLLLTTLRPDIYPNPYQFPLNYSLVISISVLIFILLTTSIVLIYSDFQLTPQFGFFLLAVYFCYLIFQIHLVL